MPTLKHVNGGGELQVSDAAFGQQFNESLVHQVITAYRNAGRAGTKAQKTRAEVRGVGKKPKDPVTGQVYILESDAQTIEGLVNAAVGPALKNEVVAVQFTLARNDDLSSNQGATLNGTIKIVALAYIKNFKVTASFTRSLAVAA